MFVTCSCGRRHWGRYGAAGLLITDRRRSGVVLQQRSALVHQGGTWACIGGAIERGETPRDAALREAWEEDQIDPDGLTVQGTLPGTDHPEWSYTYVVAEAARSVTPRVSTGRGWESDGAAWIDLEDVASLALHPGLRADWPRLRADLRSPGGSTR